jgi:putative MATE family efflux protein
MTNGRERATLTQGPVLATMLRMALPMMVGIASIAIFGLVDTWFVSRLGGAELAALGFAFPVMMVVGSVAFGLGIGATSVISRAIGSADPTRVRRLTTDALSLSVLVVALLAGLGLLFLEPLFRALGATEEVLPHIVAYMAIWFPGMVFLVIPMVGNAAIRATGDTKTPAVIMVVAGGANALLDPLLIFGFGPIEGMGVAGAALASVITRAGTLVVALWILGRREKMIESRLPSFAQLRDSWSAIMAVGAPAALANVAVPLTMGLVIRLTAGYGDSAVAAFGAGARLEMMAMIPAMGVAASLAPFAGQNHGAGRTDRVRAGLKVAAVGSIAWGALAWLALVALSGTIAPLFADEAAVAASLRAFLIWGLPGMGLLGALTAVSATLNAIGRPLDAAGLNLARMPLLIALPALGGALWGLSGLFVGIAVANALAGGLALLLVGRRIGRSVREPATLVTPVPAAA